MKSENIVVWRRQSFSGVAGNDSNPRPWCCSLAISRRTTGRLNVFHSCFYTNPRLRARVLPARSEMVTTLIAQMSYLLAPIAADSQPRTRRETIKFLVNGRPIVNRRRSVTPSTQYGSKTYRADRRGDARPIKIRVARHRSASHRLALLRL